LNYELVKTYGVESGEYLPDTLEELVLKFSLFQVN